MRCLHKRKKANKVKMKPLNKKHASKEDETRFLCSSPGLKFITAMKNIRGQSVCKVFIAESMPMPDIK